MLKKHFSFNSFFLQVDGWKLKKITEKIIRENALEHTKKETRVKSIPGLSANRPSNNWAQVYNFHCNIELKYDVDFRHPW